MKRYVSSFFRQPGWFALLAVVFLLGNSPGYSSSSEEKSELVGKAEATPTKGTQVDTTSVRSKPGEYLPAPDEFVPYDEPPEFVKRVEPKYPPLAKLSGVTGTVFVQVLVDKNGKVRDVKIQKDSGTNPGLEQAAIEAAKQSEFTPAISNGQPIAVWIIYPYNFVTKDKPSQPDKTKTRQTKTTQGAGTTAKETEVETTAAGKKTSRDLRLEVKPSSVGKAESPPAKEILLADTISIKEKPEDHVPAANEFVPYDVPPKFVKRVAPKYPPLAKLSGVTGTVFVQVLVDKNGKVRDVKIYKDSSTNAGLEQAAIDAAKASEFSPAISKGQPIAVWIIYPYDFTLKNK